MNYELFIAKRLLSRDKNNFSKPIVKLAIISIALGLSVMIISVAILTGFQKKIQTKVIGFASHIQISKFDSNSSFEPNPISKNQDFYPCLDTIKGIKHIQVYAIKAGIIKTNEEIEGVVLKGVDSDYDWSFFKKNIIKGNYPEIKKGEKSKDVLISEQLALKLNFDIGDKVRMYFVTSGDVQPRGRVFNVCGIYKTGLEDFDKLYIFCDIANIQKLNRWSDDQIAGFEVLIDNFKDIDKMLSVVYHSIGYDLDALSIKQLYPQIFDWLELQNMNVVIILVLMLLVSGVTMISTLLILIIERTNMIGILKALGSKNKSIRKIFLYNASYLIVKGLFYGNVFGLLLCLLQKYFRIIKLPEETYYVSAVPINLNLFHILYLNAGAFIICFFMLIIPSMIVSKISPIKTIRYN